jgi:hypothetical protein
MSPEKRSATLAQTLAAIRNSERLVGLTLRLRSDAKKTRGESARVRGRTFAGRINGAADLANDGESIKEKVATGLLPRRAAHKTFYGHGEGHPCVACGSPINRQDIEVEADFDEMLTLRFHSRRYDAWRRVCGEPPVAAV